MATRRGTIIALAMLLGAHVAPHGAPPVRADAAAALDPSNPATATAAVSLAPGGRDSSDADLRPTTAVPWNPDRPVPEFETWETVLRFPGAVVSLPLTAIGFLAERGMIRVESSDLIPRIGFHLAALSRIGLTVAPASLGDRTGFGLKTRVTLPPKSKLLGAEFDASTANYNSTRLDLSYGPGRLEYGYDWRPRERFFGLGIESDDEDHSTFASQRQFVRLGIAYASPKDRSWRYRGTAWVGPREIITRAGREAPSFDQVFPALSGSLNHRVEHFVYGVRAALDSRHGVPHWSRGVRLAVGAERFDKPIEALALRTSRTAFEFTRLEYQAEGGVSFHRDRRTLRLALRVVDNRPDASAVLLAPDLAILGGGEGLLGFEPGRFHDTDLILGKLSYIFPLALRLELDLHAEAGAVYGDVWNDARFSTLEHSYGVMLRPRIDTSVLGAVGIEWSSEAVRVRFSIGGVE